MNVKRIAVFVGILFLATAAAAFPFGFIRGYVQASGRIPPGWLVLGQALAVPIASILVIALLAKRQQVKTWDHAWTVAIGAWLMSFPINVLLLRQPIQTWFVGVYVMCVAVVLGVPFGTYLRRLSRPSPAQLG